jgi:hypothetical protein
MDRLLKKPSEPLTYTRSAGIPLAMPIVVLCAALLVVLGLLIFVG